MSVELAPTRHRNPAEIGRLPLPEAVSLRDIVWPYAFTLSAYHLVALLALAAVVLQLDRRRAVRRSASMSTACSASTSAIIAC